MGQHWVTPPLLPQTPKQEWSIGTAEYAAADRPPRELYRRLKLIAGLIRAAGKLPHSGRYLLWRDPQGKVRHRLIDRDLVIGRSPDCDIVLESPNVSRRHVLIRHHPQPDILVDLTSSNGISVNGQPETKPLVLRDTDVVGLSHVKLIYNNKLRTAPG